VLTVFVVPVGKIVDFLANDSNVELLAVNRRKPIVAVMMLFRDLSSISYTKKKA
jgi:hypothetical protein